MSNRKEEAAQAAFETALAVEDPYKRGKVFLETLGIFVDRGVLTDKYARERVDEAFEIAEEAKEDDAAQGAELFGRITLILQQLDLMHQQATLMQQQAERDKQGGSNIIGVPGGALPRGGRA